MTIGVPIRVGVALLSAPLLAAAQSPHSLGPLALVALVPWLWAARRAGPGEALATGAAVGTLYGCLVAPWIPEALRSLGSSSATALLGLVFTAAWAKLALFTGVAGVACGLRDRSALVQVGGVAAAFGVGEGAIGAWRLGVPWALVGHSQLATLGTAQLAVVGGVPLLSAWVAAINEGIALSVARHPGASRLAAALAGAWTATALLGLPLARLARPAPETGAGVTLLLVQPDLPRRERWVRELQPMHLERVAAFSERALAETDRSVDAVVWPENLLTAAVDADAALSSALRERVRRWGVPLVAGLVRSPPSGTASRYRSSVVWIDPQTGLRDAIDKVRAIPLLESSRALPVDGLLASLYGRAARWPKVEEAAQSGALRGAFAVTPVLCYEALFPGLVAQRRAPDSLAVLNLADDGWVTGDTATRQLTHWAVFRAIEQRLPLVRVAHGGLSAAFDPYGRPTLTLPLDRYASATIELAPSIPPTASEKAVLLALPLLAGGGIWWGTRARGKRRR